MKDRSYFVFSNGGAVNDSVASRIEERMNALGWSETSGTEEAALIFCLGGDGALLRLMRSGGFPDAPIVGVNTGHLGYFQEIEVEQLDEFFEKVSEGDYDIQEYIGLEIDIFMDDGSVKHCLAINEVVIRGEGERLMHLGINIKGRDITKFSGDGVLICTPAGSTAYNYSLGGAVVDPSVDMLQITPMAPVNNTAYRSFISSIIMPTDTSIIITPDEPTPGDGNKNVVVIEDGGIVANGNVRKIILSVSGKKAKILRLRSYDFWAKVKEKITG